MTSEKKIILRTTQETPLGKTIAYMQTLPINNQELVVQTLQMRFFSFTLDREDLNLVNFAIQCANECEAWARAIREYAGLPNENTIPS